VIVWLMHQPKQKIAEWSRYRIYWTKNIINSPCSLESIGGNSWGNFHKDGLAINLPCTHVQHNAIEFTSIGCKLWPNLLYQRETILSLQDKAKLVSTGDG